MILTLKNLVMNQWKLFCLSFVLFNVIEFTNAQNDTYYVSPYGLDTNNGTSLLTPFKTISKASEEADSPGDKVFIRGGIYREGEIEHTRDGEPGNYITFENYNNENVIIKGSEIVEDWEHFEDNIWVKEWNIHSQQVFYDGEMLRKVGYPNSTFENDYPTYYIPITECDNPFKMCEGTFYYDESDKKLYVWLPGGLNPNQHLMEVSTKRWIWRNITGSYVKLKGLNFMHTNLNGTIDTATNAYALIGAAVTVGDHAIVEDCTFSYCDHGGLHLNNLEKPVGADLGQEVRNCTFHHNGVSGLTANNTGGFLIENNKFFENGFRPFNSNWASAAIKVMPNAWGEIRDNYIFDEYAQGIWFDTCTTNGEKLIHGNYIENVGYAINESLVVPQATGHGIFIELSANAKVYNNIIINAYDRGIYLSTSWNSKVSHNLITATKNRGQIGFSYNSRFYQNADYYLENNEVFNNILYNKSSTMDIEFIYGNNYITYDSSWNNKLDNNLVYNSNGAYLYKHLGYPVSPSNNGNYYNLTDWFNETGNDENSLQNQNPSFNFNGVSTGLDYWSLQTNSPAIDKGKYISYVDEDYINTPRPQLKYDIGPYEYDLGYLNRLTKFESAEIISIFPNPAKESIMITCKEENLIEEINILNLMGKPIKTFIKDFQNYLDISDIKPGIYLVKVKLKKKELIVKRLVVK